MPDGKFVDGGLADGHRKTPRSPSSSRRLSWSAALPTPSASWYVGRTCSDQRLGSTALPWWWRIFARCLSVPPIVRWGSSPLLHVTSISTAYTYLYYIDIFKRLSETTAYTYIFVHTVHHCPYWIYIACSVYLCIWQNANTQWLSIRSLTNVQG